ncbi:MAG: hypothetical protein IJ723_06075, partial [Ruminococcus sp.]|nr:hypothetical protein [Ruminococcus sp.]
PKDFTEFGKSELDFKLRDHASLKCSVVVDDEDINRFIAAIRKFRIKSFAEHSVTLEEYFMHFYKNDRTFGGMGYA